MKKKFSALLAAMLLVLSLTACGASSAKKESAMAPAASAPAAGAPMEDVYYGADMELGYVEEESSTGSVSGQKLIRTASLEMETMEFETTVQALEELVAKLGGYMESSNLRNRGNGYRYANYVIRIPAGEYEEFLNQAGSLCHETWRSTSQEDISEMYYDTQGRLKTQQIKLERLQELLTKADNMEDIITITSAISETEQMIDSLTGTLRHYDGKVDYSTIDLSLNEVYKYSNTEEAPVTFGERLGSSFVRGWNNFVDALEDLAVSFAYSWMWWLIFAAAVVLVVRIVRRRGSGKKMKLPSLRRKKKNGDNSGEN